ncbi:hypothetical protein Areg01_89100 [Actinoplanes regularis]|nr:hypothetical protein Areg01_89100 [Actinoplanes regularis]
MRSAFRRAAGQDIRPLRPLVVSRAAMGPLTFERIEQILRKAVEQDAAIIWSDRFTYEFG